MGGGGPSRQVQSSRWEEGDPLSISPLTILFIYLPCDLGPNTVFCPKLPIKVDVRIKWRRGESCMVPYAFGGRVAYVTKSYAFLSVVKDYKVFILFKTYLRFTILVC